MSEHDINLFGEQPIVSVEDLSEQQLAALANLRRQHEQSNFVPSTSVLSAIQVQDVA